MTPEPLVRVIPLDAPKPRRHYPRWPCRFCGDWTSNAGYARLQHLRKHYRHRVGRDVPPGISVVEIERRLALRAWRRAQREGVAKWERKRT